MNPADPDRSASLITARCGPVAAVVAADTPMLELAAAVSARLGLPHNPAEAVRNAADKARQRQQWAAAGIPQPGFEIIPAAAPAGAIRQAAETAGFPCVVKAISLSASQGVLRADDAAAAVTQPAGSGRSSPPSAALTTSPSSSRNTCPGRRSASTA